MKWQNNKEGAVQLRASHLSKVVYLRVLMICDLLKEGTLRSFPDRQ